MTLEFTITKKLADFTLDLSCACGPGTSLAIVGPSGAGKTTIIRILAGLERPDAGKISLNGVAWVDTEKKIFLPPRKRNLGYVFQEYSLFPHLTVEGNVAYAAGNPQNVRRFLLCFNIWHLRERKPKHLSGGERQRVAFAQALAREPGVLLLDEPFSALDVETRENLREVLQQINRESGVPVIHVTHNLEDALNHADQVVPVERGRISATWLPRMQGGRPEIRDSRVGYAAWPLKT